MLTSTPTPLSTPAAFLEAFRAALEALQPTLATAEGCWPAGPRLRLQVPGAPAWRKGPAIATPTTLVWYHRTGDWRGLIDSGKVAVAMGLPVEEALALGWAEDVDSSCLPRPASLWRESLVTILREHAVPTAATHP